MTTNAELAPASARPSEPVLETRAARPGAPAAPAVHTRRTSDPADIARQVEDQGRQINRVVRTVQRSEATRRLRELKERGTQILRETVDRRDRDARRGKRDVLNDIKITRINRGIDDVERRELEQLRQENARLTRITSRPALGVRAANNRSRLSQIQRLHQAATRHYLFTGETQFRGHSLRDLERQAAPHARQAWGGSAPDGGFLVLPDQDLGPIEKLLQEVVPMRQYAQVVPINTYTYRKPIRTSTPGAKWGDELTAPSDNNGTPKYALLDYPAQDLYADPIVSQDMLEDTQYPIEQEIQDASVEDFGVAEGVGFISGDGNMKPLGILGYGSDKYVADANWAFGKVGWLTTGASGAFPTPSGTTGSGDPIMTMPYSMKAAYRQNAKWMMNRMSIGVCRTLKDADGRYIWVNANLVEGQPATLDGREVIEAEQMPDIGADSMAIALADWEKAYVIVDRVGLSVLRDQLTQYPNVMFRTRKRVGGGIKNFEALKFLKFSGS
jgi:HK97 family phage major capsid protein